MAEIYRDEVDKAVALGIPGAVPTELRFERPLKDPIVIANPQPSVLIPYSITHLGGEFDVVWTYSMQGATYTRKETHSVITPFFKKEDLLAWDSDFKMLSDEQIYRLERIIRGVIENVTGQKFNYEYGSMNFRGSGGSSVSLPKRLVSAESINQLLEYAIVDITNDGWMLRTTTGPTWIDNLAASNGVITNPWYAKGIWRSDTVYELKGYFGYQSLPSDIVLAAKILAEDYGCDESLWRDRYIDNIRAADWRFEFDPKAFSVTGNVKVDQLLEKYTLNRMVIL